MLKLITALLIISIGGCTQLKTHEVPIEYHNKTATINDTFERKNGSNAHIFFIDKVNKIDVHDAASGSNNASYNNGPQLITQGATHIVEAAPITLTLTGKSVSGAPIAELFNDPYKISGDITFTPSNNERYLVKGKLSKNYSAVWIEDINGNVASTIVEKFGSNTSKANAYKDSIFKVKKINRDKSRQEIFTQISTGESSANVIAKIGTPDTTEFYPYNLFSGRPAVTEYIYNDLGIIRLSTQANTALYVQKIIPSFKLDMNSKDSINTLMTNTNGLTLRYTAKDLYKQNITDKETLDLIAEKIWLERHTEDKYMADAIAWLCKSIMQAKNPRYKEIMKNTYSQASSSKLKKYAKNAYKSLPTTETLQFKIKTNI